MFYITGVDQLSKPQREKSYILQKKNVMQHVEVSRRLKAGVSIPFHNFKEPAIKAPMVTSMQPMHLIIDSAFKFETKSCVALTVDESSKVRT